MKPQSRIVLVLTILLLGTILFVKRSQRPVDATYALPEWELPIDTSKVLTIAIQKPDGSITFERTHGTWRYELDRERLPADSFMVTRLLAGVADFRLLGLVSSNPRKQDLFEVGEAGTPIVVTSEQGKVISLVVGKMSSLPYRSYIRPTTSDMIFLASGLTPEVTGSATIRWFRGTRFHLDAALILSIHIRTHQEQVTVHRQGGEWFSEHNPIPTRVMKPVMASLQEIRGEDAHGVPARRHEEPVLSMEIQERKKERFEFYQAASTEGGCIMRTSISPRTYVVGDTTLQPFLQLARFVTLRTYGASRSEAESPTSPQSYESQSDLGSQQSALPRREPSIPKRPTGVPQNMMETTSKSSAEDDGILSVHTVKPGETLESIARYYKVPKDKLKQWNLITKDVVAAGSELYVFVKK